MMNKRSSRLIAWLLALGLGMPLLSGAGLHFLLPRYALLCAAVSLCCAALSLRRRLFPLALGGLMYLFAPQLITLFNRDPAIVAYGVTRTRICALFYCLVGFSHTASAVVRGLGKPMTPMIVMLVCWCLVRVLTLLTIGQVWHDIRLVCWIYPFTWSLSSAVYVFYLPSVSRRMLPVGAGG